MQRLILATTIFAAAALLVVFALPRGSSSFAAQVATPAGSATLTADDGELADLRNQVAALSTRVAELGGADSEAIAGRLGGSRAGFDARYGRPAAYLAPDEVGYDVPEIGRVSVRFVDDRATRIVLTAPRPPDVPLDESDPADWSDIEAMGVAVELYPTDTTSSDVIGGTETAFVVDSSSEALTSAMTPADELGCPIGGETPFTATFAQPAANQVAVIVVETAPPGRAAPLPVEPAAPAEGQLSQVGARTVANSSLGGTVSVNGVQLAATAARPDAVGTRAAAADYEFYSIDVRIENDTRQPLSYELGDFILVDKRGREATAICGGIEPAIGRGALEPGTGITGVVTFEVPDRFRAERFVVLVNGARVGFLLR